MISMMGHVLKFKNFAFNKYDAEMIMLHEYFDGS